MQLLVCRQRLEVRQVEDERQGLVCSLLAQIGGGGQRGGEAGRDVGGVSAAQVDGRYGGHRLLLQDEDLVGECTAGVPYPGRTAIGPYREGVHADIQTLLPPKKVLISLILFDYVNFKNQSRTRLSNETITNLVLAIRTN